MDTKIELSQFGENLVYIKSVDVAELPDDIRHQAGDQTEIYSVHNAEGEQLALVADRAMAFELARQHDMSPVTVH